MKLKEICDDLFNVAKRLKEIDENYFVVFNKDRYRFEVCHKKQKDGCFCFAVEGNLDFRTVKKAIKTSVKFAQDILRQIEKDNCLLEKQTADRVADENMAKFKSYIDYANAKNCDVDFSSANQTEWI